MINDNDDASYVAEALAEARQPTPDYIRENDLWWGNLIWWCRWIALAKKPSVTHLITYIYIYDPDKYVEGTWKNLMKTWENDWHEWRDVSIPQVKRPMRPTKQLAKKDRELIRVQRAIIRSRRFELRDYAEKRHKKFTSTQALVKETLRSVRRNEVDP